MTVTQSTELIVTWNRSLVVSSVSRCPDHSHTPRLTRTGTLECAACEVALQSIIEHPNYAATQDEQWLMEDWGDVVDNEFDFDKETDHGGPFIQHHIANSAKSYDPLDEILEELFAMIELSRV